MFRQHTPRMHPHIHLPEHLLLWLGLGALIIVVALIAGLYVRTPPATAPVSTLPQPAVTHPYDGSAYVPYVTKRPAVSNPYDGSAYVPYVTKRPAQPWSLGYGQGFNPGTGTVYDGKGYGNVTAPAMTLDPAQQGVIDYVRAHDVVKSQPAVKPNVRNIGTGSAYDGKHYGSVTAPAMTLDPAQQGVMNYVRVHDVVKH